MLETNENRFVARLLKLGLIDQEQLEAAEKSGTHPIYQAIIDQGFLSKDQVYEHLADDFGVAYIDLNNFTIEEDQLTLLPEELARKFTVIPVFSMEKNLGLAMADPGNVEAIDQVGRYTGLTVDPFLSAEEDIKKIIDGQFAQLGSVAEMIEDLEVTRLQDEEEEIPELKDLSDEAPITKLVNLIFAQAVRDGASDIHIEPDEHVLRIRFRIDGVLYEVPSPPKHLKAAITSRIKVMSNMNIAETRKPQDGHIRMRVEGKNIDVRVSMLPTVFGENVVLRILDPRAISIGLEELGFSEATLKKFKDIIFRPHGVLLNTGPTGSGKTTTLYAALQTVNSLDKNIITVEDPVEYRLKLIRQVQVNEKVGVTFANGLRAILRQDPDIIMIGEIRDVETAEIAIQAALTGHFVFSTLHTNDASGAAPRMVHMGVEPFLVAAALEGIMAQRLVRKICPECKESFDPDPLVLEKFGIEPGTRFHRGKGCEYCRGTGYKGRIAILELIDVTTEIRHLILRKASVDEIREQARKDGAV
ncbi:MAG: ATPase, T2SS/T4P/T4SS family, partial [Candidatus Auribacterota bacterium]|nr:ATPase, T2SS/T4P/T4SS family [Candidatus Auribacterota bacterium]